MKAVFMFVTATLVSVPLLFHVYATSNAQQADVRSAHDQRDVLETAKLKIITLPVQVKLPDASEFIDASDGMDIPLGTTVKTGKTGRAGIVYPSGTTTRLDHDTTILLKEFDVAPQQITVEILNGRVWSRVKKLMGNESYETEVQGVTATVRGTAYEHSATEEAILTRVIEGQVDVSCNDANVQMEVTASQKALTDCTLPEDQIKVQPLTIQDAEDEWIQFNATIDKLPVITPSMAPHTIDSATQNAKPSSLTHPAGREPVEKQEMKPAEERKKQKHQEKEPLPLPSSVPLESQPSVPPAAPIHSPTDTDQPSPPVSIEIENEGVEVGVQLPGVNIEVGIGRGQGNANGREGGNGDCNGVGNPNCKGKE
jgi:hypothetical protein